MVVDNGFGYTVHAFIIEDIFVSWDPNEFNVKRIRGKEKVMLST